MLSNRLLEIAKLVDKNKVVYDIGSDHGLLPCFLVLNDICPKAYAVDNKVGPLNRTKEAIERYKLEGRVVPILSDGLNDVGADAQIITIAGMGYFTLMDIFEGKDLSKYEKLIIQINKDVDKLRRYISDHNYTILDERIVKEDKFYQIIVFNTNYHDAYSEMEINYGPILLKEKSLCFKEYLEELLIKNKLIYERCSNEKALKKVNEIESLLDIIING